MSTKKRNTKRPARKRKQMAKVLPKWKRFETFVAQIQKKLEPHAKVTPNDKILGRSGLLRQIDVSVKAIVGGLHDILMILDCKDHKTPADINKVDGLYGMMQDVSAHKGAIVCNKGFTDGAKKRAKEINDIQLLYAFDSGSVDWILRLAFRVFCVFSGLKEYNLSINSHDVKFPEGSDLRKFIIYNKDGTIRDFAWNMLIKLWNSGQLPGEPGEHRTTLDTEAYIKTKDVLNGPFQLDAVFRVESNSYYKIAPITECQGFVNAATDKLHATELTLELGILKDIESTWNRMDGPIDPGEGPIFRFLKPLTLIDHES
jgi:hypothetical protein